MSEYLDNLVKCFSNSNIGVNLTTVLIDNEPWFIAKEVADILGYDNAPQAIRTNVNELDQKMLSCAECKEIFSDLLTIDEEDSLLLNAEDPETVGSYGSLRVLRDSTRKSAMKINSNGMKIINEPGLYSLIFSSKKPEAQQFQRWVTSEVLPSIRKTGSYGIAISKEERLMLNVLTAETKEDKLVALDALEQHHREEKRALEAEKDTLVQERDHAIKTKSQINDKRTATLMGKTGALTKENARLKGELETANNSVKQLTAERDIALLGLYNSKEVSVSLKNKYPFIKYAEKTLRTKVSKALKTISLALGESIRDQPNPKDPSYSPTPYFTKRTVDQLFECIERDSNYLKSFK